MYRQEGKGFTLIELLVVISIIALLMAILMPALSRVKEQARNSMDLSNQHQFGLFWIMYTDEHDMKFPVRGSGSDIWGDATMNKWPFVMYDFMPAFNQKIWVCPSAMKPFVDGGRYPFAAWTAYGGSVRVDGRYCVNFWIADNSGSEFWRTPGVRKAAYAPLLIDGNWKDCEPEPTDQPPVSGEWIERSGWEPDRNEMKRVCHFRHKDQRTT